MKDFDELKVWQKAHQLTLAVYRTKAALPRGELYGLTTQLADRVLRSLLIWPKDAGAAVMVTLGASVPSQCDLPVNSSTIYYWLET